MSVLEMFVGEVTWGSGAVAAEALAGHEAQDPAIPLMPAEVVKLLAHCFRPQPEDRPATMLEVARVLQTLYARLVGQPYPREAPKPAEALADSGRLDQAMNTIEAALELGRSNGTYFQLAELLRIESCIRERSGAGTHEVEQMLHKAADIAALQRTAIGRLRVAVELGRRFRKRKDAKKARSLITPHIDLINKLGDSVDARAARELL